VAGDEQKKAPGTEPETGAARPERPAQHARRSRDPEGAPSARQTTAAKPAAAAAKPAATASVKPAAKPAAAAAAKTAAKPAAAPSAKTAAKTAAPPAKPATTEVSSPAAVQQPAPKQSPATDALNISERGWRMPATRGAAAEAQTPPSAPPAKKATPAAQPVEKALIPVPEEPARKAVPKQAGGAVATKPDPVPSAGPDRSEEDDAPEKADKNWRVPATLSSDDPLLASLTVLLTLLDRSVSPNALVAGLPLENGLLTPELLVRAAARVGASARIMRRPLKRIRPQDLPCLLMLSYRRACVLTSLSDDEAEIIVPELGSARRKIPAKELDEEYIGYLLLARPNFQFDDRATARTVENPKGWFWGAVFRNWRIYIEVMLAAVLINCFALASPLFIMNVYDRVVPNFAEETLWVLSIGVVCIIGFDFLLKTLRSYFVDYAGKQADGRIANRLFQQVLDMKMADRPTSAGALANSLREFEHLREFFTSSTLIALVDLPFIFLFILIISWVGGTQIAMVPLLAVPLVLLIGLMLQWPLKRAISSTFREAQQKHAILIESITGIETIKKTVAESQMQRNWEMFVDMTARSAAAAHRWSSIGTHISGAAMQLVTVGVVFYGVYLIHAGDMTVGALVASTILAGRAMAPMGQVAGILTRFHQSRTALKALDDLMQARVERPEGRRFVSRPALKGQIEFKNVTFSYPGQKSPALLNMSMKIGAGERVAIIGRIGSGKSTVERLVNGLFDPDEGAVLVDGIDVRQLDPADLRRNIGVVPQDVYLFHGSVRDNIAIGAPYADDAAILRAAKIAGVDEFVSKHPHGFDLQVGERGQSLSGGQRQAVAVARALLMHPPIFIMDEPTSAMDNTSESRFKERLVQSLGRSTLIMVTHRTSLLSLVDRVIVVDGGKVVADGPKDDVVAALQGGRIHTVAR